MEKKETLQIAFQDERSIDARAVRALYDEAHWWPERTVEDIDLMLAGADLVIGVWDEGELVAFARAITDGRFRAYIEDVVVHPAYRRMGIAIKMLGRLVQALGRIDIISLFCEPDLVMLYEQLGFKTSSQVVMHRPGSRAVQDGAG